MNVTVYAEKVTVDTADSSVTLKGVDINNLVAELNVEQVLDAICENDMGDHIKSYFLEHLNGKEEA